MVLLDIGFGSPGSGVPAALLVTAPSFVWRWVCSAALRAAQPKLAATWGRAIIGAESNA